MVFLLGHYKLSSTSGENCSCRGWVKVASDNGFNIQFTAIIITEASMHMCEARDATRQLYYLHVAMMTFTRQNVHQPLKKAHAG